MHRMKTDQQQKFTFDLEKELLAEPERRTALLHKVDKHVQTIKGHLRTGQNEQEFDQLGVLLKGYVALQKVLSKIQSQ